MQFQFLLCNRANIRCLQIQWLTSLLLVPRSCWFDILQFISWRISYDGIRKRICTRCVALITDSIARSASLPVFNLLRDRFWVFFCPAGAILCTDRGEIWHGPLLRAKFHPHRRNDKGVGLQKLKFLLRFDQNVEYKRPARAYPLRDFHKICRIYAAFQDALGVKILLDLLKGLWSYGGFKLRGSCFPQIFSAP